MTRTVLLATGLVLAAAAAQATQPGQVTLKNWKAADVCAKKAQQASPDFTAEGNAKRIAQGATKGIPAQITAGQGAVRMMDVIIRPLIATNKPVQAQWAAAKRSAGGSNLGAPVAVPAQSQSTVTQPTTAAPATGGATSASVPSPTSPSQPAPSASPTAAAA